MKKTFKNLLLQNQQANFQETWYVTDLSTQMSTENQDIMKEVGTINRKIDSLTKQVNDLQTENDMLKSENAKMQKQLFSVASKLDYIEGQSRRNNVRITGLHGRLSEDRDTTEEKVRAFIQNDLNMPEMEGVEIERAHRIKSYDQNKCTIIVKFNRYKDREAVLKKASEVLDEDTSYSVRQDLTQRVKKHKRELGKEMIAAKARGQEARIKFDKLIIDGELFRYDDATEQIVAIPTRGRAHGSARAGSADHLHHLQETSRLASHVGFHGDHGAGNDNDSAGNQNETEGEAIGGAMGGPGDVLT